MNNRRRESKARISPPLCTGSGGHRRGERVIRKVLLIAAAGASLAGCSTYHRPTPQERIHIVDSPAYIRACRRLGEVSGGLLPTSPGFAASIEAMLTTTVALGGTDLFLQRVSPDWAHVRGIAYRCPFARPERIISTLVRSKG